MWNLTFHSTYIEFVYSRRWESGKWWVCLCRKIVSELMIDVAGNVFCFTTCYMRQLRLTKKKPCEMKMLIFMTCCRKWRHFLEFSAHEKLLVYNSLKTDTQMTIRGHRLIPHVLFNVRMGQAAIINYYTREVICRLISRWVEVSVEFSQTDFTYRNTRYHVRLHWTLGLSLHLVI